LDGDYRAAKIEGSDLPDYFARRRGDPDWVGCNVTIPHKRAVVPHVDRIEPAAARIGAVNLVVREADALVGANSDSVGFLEPLGPLLAQRHLFRIARIIGAGGAARAVAHALWGHGFTLVIVARDRQKAEALRADFEPAHTHVGDLTEFAQPTAFAFDDRQGIFDLVVNATPLGMTGRPPLEIDFSHVPPGAVVYDIVYAPLETPLLAEARARGLRTIDGLAMLIGQAAVSFERFFGAPAPREHDPELRERLTR
jgi:shikimate dehydrogenase